MNGAGTGTDDLIARLSAEAPAEPLRPARLALAITVAILVPAAVFLLVLGPRPDLMLAWSNPVVPFKTILPLSACAVSLFLLLRLVRPGARAGSMVWFYAVPALAAVALWVGAFVLRGPAERFAEVGAKALAECLGSILLLSILPTILILRVILRGASTAPMLSGAVAGLTAASGAAAGYSLFCTRDNPLFFVTWYGLAILIVTLISAGVGRRMLRW